MYLTSKGQTQIHKHMIIMLIELNAKLVICLLNECDYVHNNFEGFNFNIKDSQIKNPHIFPCDVHVLGIIDPFNMEKNIYKNVAHYSN